MCRPPRGPESALMCVCQAPLHPVKEEYAAACGAKTPPKAPFSEPHSPQNLQTALNLLKTVYVQHENGRAAHGNFHRERGVHAHIHGGGTGHNLRSAAGMLRDDTDDFIDLFVFHTGDEGGVAGHQEAAGGSELCDGEAASCQCGRDRTAVIVADNRKDQFHNIYYSNIVHLIYLYIYLVVNLHIVLQDLFCHCYLLHLYSHSYSL